MSIATYMMGHFGVVALAASQVVSQYSLLVVMISLGLTQALSILISKAYGEHNVKLIKMYLYASMLILLCVFSVVGIIFSFFPKELITFYANNQSIDSQLIYLGSVFFVINAFFLIADGMRNLLSGALRGLHDFHAPMRIGILTLWLFSLPASYIVGFILHGGPIGLRIAFTSGFVIAAAILWARMHHSLKVMSNFSKVNLQHVA
jgi:MATE family multidrug resistance protein